MARIGKAARKRIKAREERKKRREEFIQKAVISTRTFRTDTLSCSYIQHPLEPNDMAKNALAKAIGLELLDRFGVISKPESLGTRHTVTVKVILD